MRHVLAVSIIDEWIFLHVPLDIKCPNAFVLARLQELFWHGHDPRRLWYKSYVRPNPNRCFCCCKKIILCCRNSTLTQQRPWPFKASNHGALFHTFWSPLYFPLASHPSIMLSSLRLVPFCAFWLVFAPSGVHVRLVSFWRRLPRCSSAFSWWLWRA